MKLTTFTDYCLRVLIYLAADPDRRATIAQIATAFGVSEHHLVKVVHFLGRQGWVRTLRGRGGGLVLAKPAAEIGVGLVVRDSEGAAQPAQCFSDGAASCAIAGCCRLSGVLAEAVAAFYAVLDRYTLADLVRNREALVGVLHRCPPPWPTLDDAMDSPYPYEGPQALRGPIEQALRRVVDPEVALTIVDVGLVYGVTVTADRLRVTMTMTSAACPVTDLILDEVGSELDHVAPPGVPVDVCLVWEPPWTPERMSPRAKAFMGW